MSDRKTINAAPNIFANSGTTTYYAVKERESGKIVFKTTDPVAAGLEGKKIYKKFNAETMDLIPFSRFEKIEGHDIVPKSYKDKVRDGLFQLNEPFTSIDENGAMKTVSVQEALQKNLIKTYAQGEAAMKIIHEQVERDLTNKYSTGYQMKLMRDYLEWMIEGKTAGDDREKKYAKLQKALKEEKKKYQEITDQVKQLMKAYKKAGKKK